MFGYWATGRPNIATAPPMTVRMAITIATIGRLTKKWDMAHCSPDEAAGEAAARESVEAGVARTSMPIFTSARPQPGRAREVQARLGKCRVTAGHNAFRLAERRSRLA